MLTHFEYEQEVYECLTALRDTHPDWHFAMRHRAKNEPEQRFIGVEGRYFGTTFWKIRTDAFTGPAYPIGLYFGYDSGHYNYHFEGRQTRIGDTEQDKALLTIVNSLLEGEGGFPARASGVGDDKTNQVVKIPGEAGDYFSVERMFDDVRRDLEVLIPLIDAKLSAEKVRDSTFSYRRLTKNDTEKFERKYAERLAGLANRKHSSTTDAAKDMIPDIPIEEVRRLAPLNQILYGPPGTGKTYATIQRAVAVVEGRAIGTVSREPRQDVANRYRQYRKEGRIVFTTFHQSLSYEDFVEGLKPKLDDEDNDAEGQIGYVIKRGVFRKACDTALRSILAKRPNQATKTVLDFDRKYELLADEVKNALLEEGQYLLKSRNGGTVMVDAISSQGNFRIKHQDGTRVYSVGKNRLTKLHLGLKERAGEVSNIHDTFREIIGGSNSSAYWAVLNAVRNYQPERGVDPQITVATEPSRDALATLTQADYQQTDLENHVLIIDEINRGNVSAILGELITLLEPDKRLGAAEELTVTLPYSRDEFGVPPNLYLIGTMNTADRSVEALDAALRRRFVFEEVGPDPEVIRQMLGEEGARVDVNAKCVDLVRLLTLLNDRIAALKDNDHLLGHSYFLRVSSWEDLASVMVDRVVPLLREYFFANYAQLQLVVGNAFCRSETAKQTRFAKSDDPSQDFGDELRTYTFPRPKNAKELQEFFTQMAYPWEGQS